MLCHAAGSSACGIAWDRSADNYIAHSTAQCKGERYIDNLWIEAADMRAKTLLF